MDSDNGLPRDKPLYEPMIVRSLAHICVIPPQWVQAFLVNPHYITGLKNTGYNTYQKVPFILDDLELDGEINEDFNTLPHFKHTKW